MIANYCYVARHGVNHGNGFIDNDSLSFVFPLDPISNLPRSDMSLLMSPDTPDEVKIAIENNIQRFPSSFPTDEETAISTLCPRSCQSLAERQKFSEYLRNVVQNYNNEIQEEVLETKTTTTESDSLESAN